jgi:2-dehydropantoate 2-reductase
MPLNDEPRVVVVGAGAIGLSLAGWIAPHCENLSLLARGESLRVIRDLGLVSYETGERDEAERSPLHVIDSLGDVEPPDILVIAVKNYDLESASLELRKQLGDHQPVVVGLQNGVRNQQVLPKHFSDAIYGVVCYNAWRDEPGIVGHEPRGYIVLGTPANDHQKEMLAVRKVFDLGIDCSITDRLQDAAHCKLVVNLANPLMTLVGLGVRRIESPGILAKMTLSLYSEGIGLLQAAGFREHDLGRIPSWRYITIGARLPSFLLTPILKMNTGRLGLNSMAQDVYGGRNKTELEELNGYMLDLARKTGFPTPINNAVYETARERFGQGFQPIPERELWNRIEEERKASKNRG